MAMVGDDMGALITQRIKDIPGIHILNDAELSRFCNAVGNAIVEYIQENADVSPMSHSGEELSVSPGLIGTVTSGPGAGGGTESTVPGPLEGLGKIL